MGLHRYGFAYAVLVIIPRIRPLLNTKNRQPWSWLITRPLCSHDSLGLGFPADSRRSGGLRRHPRAGAPDLEAPCTLSMLGQCFPGAEA
jgi:hypothetical protein